MHKLLNVCPSRRFGRTEINMPVLSLGGMRFQHSWSDMEIDDIKQNNQMNLERIMHFATQNGLHHIETARHYGTSELQVGYGIQNVPDLKRIVQTKIPPKEDPNDFERELERSFLQLKCHKLDLLAIHGLNLPEHLHQTIRPGGCLDVVRKWQANGRINHVGFSSHGSTELIVNAIETDQFDYVNLHWYFIFQDNEPALAAAKKFDLGVFIISPTDKGGHLHSPSKKLLKLCSPLHPIVFNDLFCLRDQRVHTLSVGASNILDFSLHFQAVNLLDKTTSFLPSILKGLTDAAELSLGPAWMSTWMNGLPTWEKTPGGINIPTLMWLYNLYKSWGMESYVTARYRLLGNGSHWFPGENADRFDSEISEVAIRRSLRFSPWADEIIDRLRELRFQFQGGSIKPLSSI